MNIATLTMEKIIEMQRATRQKVKEYATEPYRMIKATPKEEMGM